MKLSEADKARRDLERKEIGERIRAARKQSKLKITVFSHMVGASANHISMIESGKRAPSKELLKKIADATNTSYSFLKNGSRKQNNSPTQAAPINPDPQLLLMLLQREQPELFPDTVQAILNITPDTLKSILDGSAEYEPQWRHALCSLAQRMDLAAARKALHDFDVFLEEMRLPSELQKIRAALKQYLKKNGHTDYKLQDEQTYTGRYEIYDGILMHLHTITFMEKARSPWRFKYVDVASFPDENLWDGDDIEWNEMMEEIERRVQGTVISQLSYMQETGMERMALVFCDKRWYQRFCQCVADFQFETDENGELCNSVKELTFILIDEDKGQVLDDMPAYRAGSDI